MKAVYTFTTFSVSLTAPLCGTSKWLGVAGSSWRKSEIKSRHSWCEFTSLKLETFTWSFINTDFCIFSAVSHLYSAQLIPVCILCVDISTFISSELQWLDVGFSHRKLFKLFVPLFWHDSWGCDRERVRGGRGVEPRLLVRTQPTWATCSTRWDTRAPHWWR